MVSKNSLLLSESPKHLHFTVLVVQMQSPCCLSVRLSAESEGSFRPASSLLLFPEVSHLRIPACFCLSSALRPYLQGLETIGYLPILQHSSTKLASRHFVGTSACAASWRTPSGPGVWIWSFPISVAELVMGVKRWHLRFPDTEIYRIPVFWVPRQKERWEGQLLLIYPHS